ncbi:PE family protein [Mycobacterium persicum]|uniref:PE family protein n=1 Tax=Mycobacterium persicum TaxID=1487726 RepID=UPI001F07DE4B|nr:PE family protein [Mycobacterium persicum]
MLEHNAHKPEIVTYAGYRLQARHQRSDVLNSISQAPKTFAISSAKGQWVRIEYPFSSCRSVTFPPGRRIRHEQTRSTLMQPMSFDPVVADIGSQMADLGIRSLQAAAAAASSVTGLAPAGADEVSAQAAAGFCTQAASILALNQAAQEELMRTGAAFRQVAQSYTEVDEAAAESVLLALFPMTNPWLAW